MSRATRPALRILQAEGFRFSGMVDIFDAGPVVSCPLENISTCKNSTRGAVGEIVDREIAADTYILASARADFRACLAPLEVVSPDSIRITRAVASALGLQEGDPVRFVPLHPEPPSGAEQA